MWQTADAAIRDSLEEISDSEWGLVRIPETHGRPISLSAGRLLTHVLLTLPQHHSILSMAHEHQSRVIEAHRAHGTYALVSLQSAVTETEKFRGF